MQTAGWLLCASFCPDLLCPVCVQSEPSEFIATPPPRHAPRDTLCSIFRALCAWRRREEGVGSGWIWRLPTQSEVRNGTGIFCANFSLTWLFNWVRKTLLVTLQWTTRGTVYVSKDLFLRLQIFYLDYGTLLVSTCDVCGTLGNVSCHINIYICNCFLFYL